MEGVEGWSSRCPWKRVRGAGRCYPDSVGFLGRTLSCGTIAATCALACNALTGADTLAVGDRESAMSSSSGGDPALKGPDASSGTSKDASSSSSSSASSSSGEPGDLPETGPPPPPPGAIINETFASEDACIGLTVTNGATKAFDANGRSGGACKVCAVAAGDMFAELSATATKQGQATFEAYARRVPGVMEPTSATIQFNVGGASVSSSNAVGDAWGRLGGGSISVQNGSVLVVRVGLPKASEGDCLLLDDVTVAVPSH